MNVLCNINIYTVYIFLKSQVLMVCSCKAYIVNNGRFEISSITSEHVFIGFLLN